MKQRTLLISTLAALMMMGGLACKKSPTAPNPSKIKKEQAAIKGRTAADLVDEAEVRLFHKQWTEGRKLLRLVEENMPSSKEYPRTKLLLGDSYFFAGAPSYPEALVEYQSFLTYFPRNEQRTYTLYQIALCHYAIIETAERDQAETRKAIDAFQKLINEAPGSTYAVDARAKLTQCWRRIAEAELQVGIFYVKTFHYGGAEKRIKDAMEAYPDYIDRERAYFYLGEALRLKNPDFFQVEQFGKDYLTRLGKSDMTKLTRDELIAYRKDLNDYLKGEIDRYRKDSRTYFQRLVESYPNSEWSGRAKDRLLDAGQQIKEELDS